MSPRRHIVWLTAGAAALYFLLRSLPDTQCTFLHNAHEPVMVGGVEFCGENEEANFYNPTDLKFPFKLIVEPRADLTGGTLRILDDSGRDVMPHDFAISHTRQLHLHLAQVSGGQSYLHLHPEPQLDGSWTFVFPKDFATKFTGGDFRIYADFMHERSRRTVLLAATASWPLLHTNSTSTTSALYTRLQAEFIDLPVLRTGESVMLKVRLSQKDSTPLKLETLMGALGHAVLVGAQPGYAHMHPSWTGRESGEKPELAFRVRLPAAGTYTLWVHVNAGTESYIALPLVISE